jgi:hypothetical protein
MPPSPSIERSCFAVCSSFCAVTTANFICAVCAYKTDCFRHGYYSTRGEYRRVTGLNQSPRRRTCAGRTRARHRIPGLPAQRIRSGCPIECSTKRCRRRYDGGSTVLAQSSSSVRAHDEERSDERRRAKNHCRSKVLLVITARDTHRAHTPYGVTPVGGTPRRARGRYSTHTLHSVIVIPQHPPRNRDGKRPIHTQITHTDQALGAPPALGSLVEPPPAMASGAPPAI